MGERGAPHPDRVVADFVASADARRARGRHDDPRFIQRPEEDAFYYESATGGHAKGYEPEEEAMIVGFFLRQLSGLRR